MISVVFLYQLPFLVVPPVPAEPVMGANLRRGSLATAFGRIRVWERETEE